MGEEWFEEDCEYEEQLWFHPTVGGYAVSDYDDELGYLNTGIEIDTPDTRSVYAKFFTSRWCPGEDLNLHGVSPTST